MSAPGVEERRREEARSITPSVDCDVHTPVPTLAALAPWLSTHWREYAQLSGFGGSLSVARSYPPGALTTGGPADGTPGAYVGGFASSRQAGAADIAQDRQALRDHLDEVGSRYAILNCFYGLETIKNPDFAAELARAINEWLREEWLAHDDRFRASVVVTPNDGLAAAKEIERVGGDPGFVQVFLPARGEQPYGNRRFFPLHEAAEGHGLAVSVQFGGAPGNPPTPNGWSAYYLEDYVGMAQIFQAHVTSLIAEGVFARFPDLRVVLAEAGFAWVPSLLWRLDKEWKGLRREVPWVTDAPSAYFRRHFRGTLQPIDAPADPQLLDELFTQIGSEDYLLFSSDFPHQHATDPIGFLSGLPETTRERIAVTNAAELYGLGQGVA